VNARSVLNRKLKLKRSRKAKRNASHGDPDQIEANHVANRAENHATSGKMKAARKFARSDPPASRGSRVNPAHRVSRGRSNNRHNRRPKREKPTSQRASLTRAEIHRSMNPPTKTSGGAEVVAVDAIVASALIPMTLALKMK
jgi:hypothetical protein